MSTLQTVNKADLTLADYDFLSYSETIYKVGNASEALTPVFPRIQPW